MYPSREMFRIKLQFWISNKKINEWVKQKNFFFILAIGRSGTKFLSQLLNKAQNALVAHEVVGSDFRGKMWDSND